MWRWEKPASARASIRCVAKGKRARVETVATRRSTRATSGCRAPISFLDDVSEEALRALGETAAARRARLALETTAARDAGRVPRETPEPVLEDVFEDSSVLRYACRREVTSDVRGSDARGATTSSKGRAPRPNERLRGFEEDPEVVFVDPAMKKGFYSLHAATRGGTSALAAGGTEGASRSSRWTTKARTVGRTRNEQKNPRRSTRRTKNSKKRKHAPPCLYPLTVLGRAPRVVRAGPVRAALSRARGFPRVERGRDGRHGRALGHEPRRPGERASARAFPRRPRARRWHLLHALVARGGCLDVVQARGTTARRVCRAWRMTRRLRRPPAARARRRVPSSSSAGSTTRTPAW